MGKQPPTRQQLASILGAVAVVLGGGGGAAGYYLHGSVAEAAPAPAPPMERVVALEQWRAAREALEKRDAEDRQALMATLRDMNATNAGLRDAVVALTERIGAVDERLRLVEGVRPASGKR